MMKAAFPGLFNAHSGRFGASGAFFAACGMKNQSQLNKLEAIDGVACWVAKPASPSTTEPTFACESAAMVLKRNRREPFSDCLSFRGSDDGSGTIASK